MSKGIQAVRGMNDLLPESVAIWQHVEQVLKRSAESYGYQEIRLPLLERTELFKRSIGEQTDIVEKEMYTFEDNNGDSLSLRPEATASCVRAAIQHGLIFNRQVRLWYAGPMFRYERPQRGRYRQFHQFGVETFGWPGPDIDVELILLSARIWRELEVPNLTLEINSLGSMASRIKYKEDLIQYLRAHQSDLDEQSKKRLLINPLRILDSKTPETKEIVKAAPTLLDYLDSESKTHFEKICAGLDEVGIQYTINPRLVRGLDYYTRTVFEWVTDQLGAQNAVCAGGRYDRLVGYLGGKPTPGAGFAIGLERLVEIVQLNNEGSWYTHADIYMVTLGEESELVGTQVSEALRGTGFNVENHCGGGSLKRQMKRADQSGAAFALLIGEDELNNETVTIKSLRAEAPQETVRRDDVGEVLRNRMLASDEQAMDSNLI